MYQYIFVFALFLTKLPFYFNCCFPKCYTIINVSRKKWKQFNKWLLIQNDTGGGG